MLEINFQQVKKLETFTSKNWNSKNIKKIRHLTLKSVTEEKSRSLSQRNKTLDSEKYKQYQKSLYID